MKQQLNILIVLNYLTLEQAQQIKSQFSNIDKNIFNLYIIYVIEEIPAYFYLLPSMTTYSQQLRQTGLKHLQDVSFILNIPSNQAFLKIGHLRTEIYSVIQSHHLNTIVCNDESYQAAFASTHFLLHHNSEIKIILYQDIKKDLLVITKKPFIPRISSI